MSPAVADSRDEQGTDLTLSCSGAASNLTPLYISEISPPAIRGRLVGMFEMGWQSALPLSPFVNSLSEGR